MSPLLLVASFPDSLLGFRGHLLSALQAQGLRVHVAAPDLPPGSPLRVALESRGLRVHQIPLRRTGLNPLADLRLLFHLVRLMRATGARRVRAGPRGNTAACVD